MGAACASPCGVFAATCSFDVFTRLRRRKVDGREPKRLATAELPAAAYKLTGMSIAEIMPKIPAGLELVALRRHGTNLLPRPEYVFAEQDVLVVAGYPEAIAKLKGLSPGRDARADRKNLDYLMVYVSKPAMVGMR